MADNLIMRIFGGLVATLRTTDLAGIHTPHVIVDSDAGASVNAPATAAAPSYVEGTTNPLSQNLTGDLRTISKLAAGSSLAGKFGIDQTTPGTTDHVTISPRVATLTTAITRPSDTNAYAANDAFANSTSAPTTGGFTFSNAAAASGGAGVITDAVISTSGGSAIQGEIWVFDQAVTATNDNAALSVSDSDILNLVGVIPFNTNDVNAANAISYVTGLNIGFTCVGTANLRFLVKIMTAVTPASAEVLNVRLKVNN